MGVSEEYYTQTDSQARKFDEDAVETAAEAPRKKQAEPHFEKADHLN